MTFVLILTIILARKLVIAMDTITKHIDETGMLITADVLKAGFTKTQLYSFIKENNYEQVSHGVYVTPDAWADENLVISLRCSEAVFSHDEALYYYGLIDREPMQPTITIYSGYGTSRLVKDGIKVYTVKRALLDLGKTMIVNSYGHRIPMYDLERTICDLVRSRSQFEIQDYQTALRTYILRKDKDLNKLMKYAKLLRVETKIREYMEVML